MPIRITATLQKVAALEATQLFTAPAASPHARIAGSDIAFQAIAITCMAFTKTEHGRSTCTAEHKDREAAVF